MAVEKNLSFHGFWIVKKRIPLHFSSFSQVWCRKLRFVMTMTFSLHDRVDPNGAFDQSDPRINYPNESEEMASEEFHILRDKLRMPATDGLIGRPRINTLLDKS